MNGLVSTDNLKDSIPKALGWKLENNMIVKVFLFRVYMDSISFINDVAKESEKLNHHPDLIVEYCKITVKYTSHDLGGVSNNGLKMAMWINDKTKFL